MDKNTIYGFEPIINKNCKILFLGSMPSKKSRENNFYYSNPTNRFWKILSSIFNEDFINAGNKNKKELLFKHNIALYDVYKSCEMKKLDSSLDSNIYNQKLNDIPNLIKNTNITKIFITSKKAYLDFLKHFKNEFTNTKIEITNLPSPSSANRSKYKTDEELIKVWAELIKGN